MLDFLAIIVVIVGISLVLYLLLKKHINSGDFTKLFISLLATGLLLHGFDRIREVNVKDGKLILEKIELAKKNIEEAKKEVYAKEAAVKKLAEEISYISAFIISEQGNWPSEDLTQRKIKASKRISGLLKYLRVDDKKIKETTEPINKAVISELKGKVYSKIQLETHQSSQKGKQIDREKVHEEAWKLLENYNREKLVNYLKDKELYNSKEMEPLLNDVDNYLNKSVKR